MIPQDYDERVYAGWLGKCIGVRFGAPLEGWWYEKIRDNVGEVLTYLREDSGKIFKPDDDTALPMILIRAFELFGTSTAITPQQFGETWLNFLGDGHGTLWWGGYGVSTEHTAYCNLAAGIPAPMSGSIAMNGAAVAEQIGGQIFSDIFGLIAPGDPARAVDLAEKASSVSHDGNGIYGGRFIAAMVSAAFSERDPRALLNIGLRHIPADSEYARVITAMQQVHAGQPDDWHAGYAHLRANFGYDRYPGEVHIIPNAGVIALAMLYGDGNFSRTIQIANMCGWDTDCNVGNVGAIMGVAVGLDVIDNSWREPINDLLITASNTGTRNIWTIPQCADLFVKVGRALQGQGTRAKPRYHFQYPGSTSSFLPTHGELGRPIHQAQRVYLGVPCLQTSIRKLNKKGEIRVGTRTYYNPKELSGNYYGAAFSPLIYTGQTLHAEVCVPTDAPTTIRAGLYAQAHDSSIVQAEAVDLVPGQWQTLQFTIPRLHDVRIDEVGVTLRNLGEPWETGAFYIKSLDWDGTPDWLTTFANDYAESGGISQWTRVRGYWRIEGGAYHGSGVGLCESYTGDPDWTDYRLSVELTPLLGDQHGVLVRVGGARRSYAVCLDADQTVRLYRNESGYACKASAPFAWTHGRTCTLTVTASGSTIRAEVSDGENAQHLEWTDDFPLLYGQIGLCAWNNSHTRFTKVSLQPIP
ncbi:MAG: ADP-ribosylglycohydrolase family protein [Chloroflexi bacterium]|nr:ADP-ribosylglycohydrolase family protein [Chloroflexota bacterium]